MEYFLFTTAFIGLIIFFISRRKIYTLYHPGLVYADKSIKQSLYVLSKMIVFLIGVALQFYCYHHPENSLCNKSLIPLQIVFCMFAMIKIMPSAYDSHFQFATEAGVENSNKYSTTYSRYYSIVLLTATTFIIGVIFLGSELSEIIRNTYQIDRFTLNVMLQGLDKCSSTQDNEFKTYMLGYMKSCVYNKQSIIYGGTLILSACTMTILAKTVFAYKSIQANTNKKGVLLLNNIIFIKRIMCILGLISLMLAPIISYNYYYQGIAQEIKEGFVNFATDEKQLTFFVTYTFNKWNLLFSGNSLIVFKMHYIVMSFSCVFATIETLLIILKLCMAYRHKRKMVEALVFQEEINAGNKPAELDKYKGFDFTAKILDYQFNVFRFMYNPALLKDKTATIANIKSFMDYVEDIGACKLCIFMGVPLLSTSSLILAIKCFRAQVKICNIKSCDVFKNCF